MHEVLKSSGWSPDSLSGPDVEAYNGGSYRFKNDIAENLKYTDKEFPASYDSLIARQNI